MVEQGAPLRLPGGKQDGEEGSLQIGDNELLLVCLLLMKVLRIIIMIRASAWAPAVGQR